VTDQARGNREVILRLFEMINTGSIEDIDEVQDEDVLTLHPQTRERVRGREEYKVMARGFQQLGGLRVSETEREFIGGEEERYLLTPLFTMVKIQGTGETLVVTSKNHYPDGSDWYTIGLVTFRRGKILKQVLFFGPTFDPPDWRAQWVEPLESRSGVHVEQRGTAAPRVSNQVNRDAATRLFALMDLGEYSHLDEVFRTEVVTEYPQSGELVRGLENLRNVMSHYPGGHPRVSPEERVFVGDRGEHRLPSPTDSILRIHDAGDRLVSSIKTRYPDGSDWYTVSVFSFLEGKISKQIVYFAPVMPAPEWRSQWVVADIGEY